MRDTCNYTYTLGASRLLERSGNFYLPIRTAHNTTCDSADLVLDYSVSLHEGTQLRDSNRCFIEMLRERRPGREVDSTTGKDMAARFGWTGHDVDNPMGVYVTTLYESTPDPLGQLII